MINSATPQQRQHFEQQGYVVVRRAADPEQVESAVEAVNDILDRADSGEFGDQFRWTDQAQRVPAFASDFLSAGKYYPAFGELLASVMLPFTESLLGKPVRCSWLLMLTAGAGQPYSVPLHRDNSELGGADEQDLLGLYRMNQCYFQAPLLANDRFLQVVPGSHLRPATETEVAVARSNTPDIEVPGLETIELQPGDIVYRNTNLIHQGWNPKGMPRWTLVSGFWAADLPLQEIERQDFELVNTPGFIKSLPSHCRVAVQRYLQACEQGKQA
jgi:ectoine hydroxylase-related dioxygenase (phytanoyl-CoA dioxygenase family)